LIELDRNLTNGTWEFDYHSEQIIKGDEMKFAIFVSGELKPDFMSKRIMKKFGCHYSHIGMVTSSMGVQRFYHSVGKGFSKMLTEEIKQFKKEHIVWYIDITEHIESVDFARGYLEGRIGVEYSYSQYLGFVFPWLRPFVKNDKEKGICSEEAARFLYTCCKSIIRVDSSKFDFVSPQDVWQFLQKITNQLMPGHKFE